VCPLVVSVSIEKFVAKLLRAEVRILCDKFLKYTLKIIYTVKVFVNDLETEPKF